MTETKTANAVPPFVNKTMKAVLRSPLHGIVSKSILLISFTGRKSGKTHSTPVSYTQDGNEVTIFTHATWWKNLGSKSMVTVRIRGRVYQGLAEPIVADKQMIANKLAAHLRKVRSDAGFYEVTYDEQGNPRMDDVQKAVQTVVMIRVRLY